MAMSNGYRSFLAKWAVTAVVLGAVSNVRGGDPAPSDSASRSSMNMAQMVDPTGVSTSYLQRTFVNGTVFDDMGLKVRGYVEGGYTYNFDRPRSSSNGYGQLFNDKSDDPTLNQFSLIAQRDVTASANQFDMGFKAQVIYGSDARFTQANGTNFYGSRYANDFNTQTIPFPTLYKKGDIGPDQPLFNPGQTDIENQVDILQAYLTFNLPVSNGVVVTAGKFVTPWGMEQIDPTENELYSHTYIFTLATPRTLTGLTAEMQLNDDWSAMGGIVVGWDQSLEDNNSFPSFVAQTKYHYTWDPNYIWDFALSGMVGPEQAGNRSDYRWTLDLTGKTRISDMMNVGFEALVGYEDDRGVTYRKAVRQTGPNSFQFIDALHATGQDEIWGGAALYGDMKIDQRGMWVGVARVEAFNDMGGSRGLVATVYDLTLGLNVFPFINHEIGKDLIIRPEIRYDYAGAEIFDDNNRVAQISINADIVYKF